MLRTIVTGAAIAGATLALSAMPALGTPDAPRPATIGTTAPHASRPYAVSNPHKLPRWVTRPCPLEDSRGCYWDAGTAGNGRGHSFYAMPMPHGRTAVIYWDARYGARHNYVTPAPAPRFAPVTPDDARAMASTGERTASYWSRCVVRFGHTRVTVRCPDGFTYTDAR